MAHPPSLLAGRDELLAELDARLAGRGCGPRTVALWGMGGVGKTSVAAAYARRHLADVGVAWQFTAYDPTALAAEFSELAAQLGARDIADTRDPVASVHGVLAAFQAEWLLVFDNVPDRASVERFLPPAGPGRILITSQNPAWPHGQALEVPLLGPEVAADFLVDRSCDEDRQTAQELAGVMDGLPLALEQAAAYILATGGTLAEYLGLFQERRAEMLRRGEPTGYPGTVATAWALAFSRLEESSPAAVGLLRLLAFYAPEAIPLRLLLQPRPGLAEKLAAAVAGVLVPLLEDELAAMDAVAALRRYSLIHPAGDGAVSVHRLVQAVTADQMPTDLARAWREAAGAAIEAAIPDDPEQPETWSDFAALLPHAQAALPAHTAGVERIAIYLSDSGSYTAARDLEQRVLDAREQLFGPEHPATLTARINLAYMTGQAGNVVTARDQLAALLPEAERIFGSEHAGTLSLRNNLAMLTGESGDPAGARDQFAELMRVQKRVSGPEHPHTLRACASISRWTGEAGDVAIARDQAAALLPVQERVSGPEHPDTLAVRGLLARWTGAAGDEATARDLFAELVAVRSRVLGPEHPETLTAHGNLATAIGESGDAAGARDQFAELLATRRRVLGPRHPDTLAMWYNLANWTGMAGDLAGARDLFAALLSVQERVFGSNHPLTRRVRARLAYWAEQARRNRSMPPRGRSR